MSARRPLPGLLLFTSTPAAEAAIDVAKQVLIGSDYSGKDLRGATFNLSNLREANLSGSDLRGASLYGAKLQDADLSNTDLREATWIQRFSRERTCPVLCWKEPSSTPGSRMW